MKRKATDDKTTHEKIIAASIHEFSLSGFHGARIDTIAAKAGVNKAMIYYHFKNKAELYKSIIELLFSKIHSILSENASMELPPDEKLYQTLKSLSDFIADLGDDMRRVMIWEIASGGKTLIGVAGKKFRVLFPIVKKLYGDGIKGGYFRKDIDPLYTHITILGGIIASNVIHMTLKDSVIYKVVLGNSFRGKFFDHLTSIIRKGIEKK
jgi:TetR/AcrR family transcriptional regulator